MGHSNIKYKPRARALKLSYNKYYVNQMGLFGRLTGTQNAG